MNELLTADVNAFPDATVLADTKIDQVQASLRSAAAAPTALALTGGSAGSVESQRAHWAGGLDDYLWYVKNLHVFKGSERPDAQAALAALSRDLHTQLRVRGKSASDLDALTDLVRVNGFGSNPDQVNQISVLYQQVLNELTTNNHDPAVG